MSSTTSRRTFLKTVGAGIGIAAGGSVAQQHTGDDLVGGAEAIDPAAIAALWAPVAGPAGVVAAAGWLLRPKDALSSDDPPDGLSATALENDVYDTVLTRASTNASTFVDNQNIVDGAEHTAWADAKIAAIEAINDESPQADVTAAGNEAVADYFTTIKTNLLKSWNESVSELDVLITSLEDHGDTDASMVSGSVKIDNEEITLPDDSTIMVHAITDSVGNDPDHPAYDGGGHSVDITAPSGDSEDDINYLNPSEWDPVWNTIDDAQTAVEDGLGLWVDEVYGDVQSGDLDPADLLTPRELAELTADEEDFNQAVADLMALNVSVDLEREATIELNDGDVTLVGQLAWTESGTLSTGTVDVSEESGDFYLTYDVAQGEGVWSDYNDTKGVDGGEVEFTAEPYQNTTYYIDTVAGETAEVVADDFTAYNADDMEADNFGNADYWLVQVGGQLDDAVSDIEQVEFFATSTETKYETILLQEDFEIVSFEDSEGTEQDDATFERTEPQDDTNYITEEQWDDMADRFNEAIDDAQPNAGGGGGLLGGSKSLLAAGVALVGGGYLLLAQSGDGGGGADSEKSYEQIYSEGLEEGRRQGGRR